MFRDIERIDRDDTQRHDRGLLERYYTNSDVIGDNDSFDSITYRCNSN